MPPTGPWYATSSRTKVTGSGGSSCSGAATTTMSPHNLFRVRTVWTIRGSPSKGSNALGRPMRELLPPARTMAEAGGRGSGVGGRFCMLASMYFGLYQTLTPSPQPLKAYPLRATFLREMQHDLVAKVFER